MQQHKLVRFYTMILQNCSLPMLLAAVMFTFSTSGSQADTVLSKGETKWVMGKNDTRALFTVYKIKRDNGNIENVYYKLGENRPSLYETVYDHSKTLDKLPEKAKEGWFYILDKAYVTYRKGDLTDAEKKSGLKSFSSKAEARFVALEYEQSKRYD